MMEQRSASDYLNNLYEALKLTFTGLDELREALSIIVFGSASRPEDFVVGVSDVDVLALVDRKPRRRLYDFDALESRVEVTVQTVDEYRRAVELGDPLAFMARRGVVLWGRSLDDLSLGEPKVTEHTLRVLRRSALASLGLAIESFFLFDGARALTYLYHSVRHVIRHGAALQGYFPISDREVLEASSGRARELYEALINARRRSVGRSELRSFINPAIEVVAEGLGLRPTRLEDVERVAGEEAATVTAGESHGYLAFRVGVLGRERRVMEVRGGLIEEVGHVRW